MRDKSSCGVTRDEILRQFCRSKKGSAASIGERIAAKWNRRVPNEKGRLSAIEADAQDTRLLFLETPK